jgi:hypothetical protein
MFFSFFHTLVPTFYCIKNPPSVEASTYDHTYQTIRHPVRSALVKLVRAGPVLRWVTTWESPVLYVFVHFCLSVLYPLITNSAVWKFDIICFVVMGIL